MSAAARSARFVAWSNAVLAGQVSPDLAAARITGTDPAHRVDGLPGGDDQTLPVVLARLSVHAVPAVRLVLPVAGDPVGLPGPGPLTTAALEAGEAVLLPASAEGSFGLVPAERGGQVLWTAYAVDGAPLSSEPWSALVPLPSLAEADRDLAFALREATDLLADLDLARWDPDSADAVEALRRGRLDGDGLAPGYPNRAHEVLSRARRLRAIIALAGRGDGAAVTAGDAAARRAVLFPLDRAARYAEMAAHNAVLEPGASLRS
jgi:hypothetical protein